MTEFFYVVAVGVLFATGSYLLMQRSLGQVIVGLALMANGVNLLIFIAAGISQGGPPVIGSDETVLPVGAADPVPQALILTAIVISFGVLAFFIALAARAHQLSKSDDLDELSESDRIAPIEEQR